MYDRLFELSLENRTGSFTKGELFQQLCEKRAFPKMGGILPLKFVNSTFLSMLYGDGIYIPSSSMDQGVIGMGYWISLVEGFSGLYSWNVEVELTRW